MNIENKFKPLDKNDKNIEYLTPSETASALGVTVDCLRKWNEAGRLKPDIVTEGGHRRYLKERIDEIVNTRGSNILVLKNNLSEVIANEIKNQYFTNGEMIMMDNYFMKDNDCEVVLFDKRKKIIQDGFLVIDNLINVTDKYADHRIDFKIMWRACCLKLSVGYLYDCQKVVDCFRKLVLTYDFLPLFEAYKSTYLSHDYWVYRLMMCEFVSEVKNNLEIMIEEEEDKQIEQSMEKSKELAIEEFEKNEYDSLSVIHGRKIIHYYINNFTPVEDFSYLEIEVKDDDVFHALNEKFSKCRRRTLKNMRTRNNVPCIDDYLRDWFC